MVATLMGKKPVTTGGLIRETRKAKGLSQAEACKLAGLAQGFWSQLELGARKPSLKTLQKIAEALGVEARDLIP